VAAPLYLVRAEREEEEVLEREEKEKREKEKERIFFWKIAKPGNFRGEKIKDNLRT
jgi:hypothetical protein